METINEIGGNIPADVRSGLFIGCALALVGAAVTLIHVNSGGITAVLSVSCLFCAVICLWLGTQEMRKSNTDVEVDEDIPPIKGSIKMSEWGRIILLMVLVGGGIFYLIMFLLWQGLI